MVTTAGFISPAHFDPEGTTTTVGIEAGCKIWAILSRKGDRLPPDALDDIVPYQPLDKDDWKVEVVVLRPGIQLYVPLCFTDWLHTHLKIPRTMRPGVLHTVLTTEPTIATGMHLYSWVNGVQTTIALIEQQHHSNNLINAFHPALEIVRIQMLLAWEQDETGSTFKPGLLDVHFLAWTCMVMYSHLISGQQHAQEERPTTALSGSAITALRAAGRECAARILERVLAGAQPEEAWFALRRFLHVYAVNADSVMMSEFVDVLGEHELSTLESYATHWFGGLASDDVIFNGDEARDLGNVYGLYFPPSHYL